ncbi:MAG TPA: hypothetical protein VLI45_04535, partial [Acidobacteriaceae bacterium]|nr:hypothetical protein [Acidobacteriaceae bacterium]
AAFILPACKIRPENRFLVLALLMLYLTLAFLSLKTHALIFRFEPTAANWVVAEGVYTGLVGAPVVLDTKILIIVTIVCLGGSFGVIAVARKARDSKSLPLPGTHGPTWKELGILLSPFSVAYLIFLAAAAGTTHVIFDRYAIGLLGPTMIVLVRLYQEEVRPSLPLATILLIIVIGAYGIMSTHNTFALDRARVDLANELHSQGVPFTSIDGAWDYNLDTELASSNHINNKLIKIPADAYVTPRPAPPGYCEGWWHEITPHVEAVYGISFSPDRCYGRAPFPPVQYRPWPLRIPVNLYAVRYAPPAPWSTGAALSAKK